jgi:NTP pyrophosphatase (non-canonical NTP hydrolase)
VIVELREIQDKVEAVSRIYAKNCDVRRDDDWYFLKMQEETGELLQAWLRLTGRGRKKGDADARIRLQLEDELADCLAQVLLIAKRFDVDVERATERKWFKYLPENNDAGNADE